jgi:hypothetical protein
MSVGRLLVIAGVLALAACAGADDESAEQSDAVSSKDGGALRGGDFNGDLDRPFLHSASPTLTDDEFALKYKASIEAGAFMFFRSYPGAYHKDLARVKPSRLIMNEGLCFGDPHPENFGFLRISGATRFGYNDLDDSGYCPVALDALRYFSSLRQLLDGQSDAAASFDVILEQYVDTVKDLSRAKSVPASLEPDWKKENEKLVSKATGDTDRLLLDDDVVAPTAAERAAVTAVVPSTVLDVARVLRDAGGSGGLARFHVLVDRAPSPRTVVELKELVTPGVEQGLHQRTLSASERLPVLKSAFWSTTSTDDNVAVTVQGTRFLMRDRAAKSRIDIKGLDKKTREKVLLAQASEMARVHSATWGDIDKDRIRRWLEDGSKTVAERWQDTWHAGAH